MYDGGICTRIDCVSLGVVVNRDAERFYDEGEDFWPKRYAIWGRLVALQPGQVAYSIIDSKAVGRFMPAVFPGAKAQTLPELAQMVGLPVDTFMQTIDQYNQACREGEFDHTRLDNCHTEGLSPNKTHWARRIDTAPYYAYPVRPGVTFTYLSLKTDDTAAVRFGDQPCANLFVAGEMMSGNVLGKGYTGGVGMSIIGFARSTKMGVSAIVGLGNKSDLDEDDLLTYFEQDDNTHVIAMHCEDLKDGRSFAEVAKRVSQKKPVIMLKAGRTAYGAKAAASHTGALAGNDKIYDDILKASGVIRAPSLRSMLEYARGVKYYQRPDRKSVV